MNSTKQKLQSINYDFLLQGIDFNNISLKQISWWSFTIILNTT